MASRHMQGGASAPSVPLDVLLATQPSLPRPILSRLTARMIERLDEIDGDPDEEATPAEDDFTDHRKFADGPGCIVSDPDAAVDDRPCDEPFQDIEPETWRWRI
jgi:hypothetical protein